MLRDQEEYIVSGDLELHLRNQDPEIAITTTSGDSVLAFHLGGGEGNLNAQTTSGDLKLGKF